MHGPGSIAEPIKKGRCLTLLCEMTKRTAGMKERRNPIRVRRFLAFIHAAHGALNRVYAGGQQDSGPALGSRWSRVKALMDARS